MPTESKVRQAPQSYTATPYEAAFDRELQISFGTQLLPPFIDQYGRMIRVSAPTKEGDQVLAFQYTRLDPLKSGDIGAVVLLQTDGFKPQDYQSRSMAHQVADEMDAEERAEEEVRKRVMMRDGEIDPYKGLVDPNYYTNNERMVRWPETYDIALLTSGEDLSGIKPTIISKGRVFGERRADIYVRLSIPPRFEGYDNVPGFNQEPSLTVRFQAFNYRVSRAYAHAYREEEKLDPGIDWDDIGLFPDAKDIRFPAHLSSSSRGRNEIAIAFDLMEGIGRFIDELV